jgi:hypothetical protein
MLAPQMTPPDPTGVILHAVAQAMTPETVLGIVMTLAITHSLKVITAATFPSVTTSLAKWRAFCTTLSVSVGTLVGSVIWIAGGPVATLFACAFLSGPAWRFALALAPERLSAALTTETDRSFK